MALNKEGLDYYTHFIGMTNDDKLSDLRMEYGSVAIDVWLTLLDLIYGDKGYYIEYKDEKTKNRVVWKILGIVRGKYPPTPETVMAIIEDLVACELFSGDLFKSGILSSKRIQEQFYQATVERKAVEINLDYWLLDVEKMKKLSSRSNILRSFDSRPTIEENQPIIEENRPILPQSKVKKSKVKESKVEYNKADKPPKHKYGDYKHVLLTDEQYNKLVSDYGESTITEYIKKVDDWIQLKGETPYKDFNLAIRNWLSKDNITNKEAEPNGADSKLYQGLV